ncbi:phage antirepressor KilAC domain-containing protein [Micromonospora sp. WMMD1102]|uniref:phage antirepressor KilAC domain-containing protein n=1 Tax=Micromonospora sp. WMMD1102 TaxID=3016105 RepID=UPI002414EE62|nr:phage antirepressor KilAC domain-containing protein [Micromonospora sp. WMMD1102]MDG4791922.1 phage antirepressor KilAC domain-containing protein [Micromonospora sp. WMMD1102]
MTQLELSAGVSPFDAIRQTDAYGEFWTGRALMPLMEYASWEKFAAVIEKAKASLAIVQGAEQAEHHFTTWGSDGGRWGNQRLDDYRLTRFGAYLVAMAGDDTKPAVAHARVYFAVKTREAEVAPAPRQLSRRDLAQMVIDEADRADRAEAQLAIAAPAADAWNTLAAADGDWSVADAAKVLSRDPAVRLGQGRLFTVLFQLGWTFRQKGDGRWRVYQDQINAGRMSELPSSHYHPRTGELVIDPPQVRVKAKGLAFLLQHLGGREPLQLNP